VIKLEAGHDSTTVSQTDTEYDSCGCSPIGKMKRASMAHAPAGAVYWTTYNYDGLGRTVSVVSPDGASTKTHAYLGNTVTATDEAGKWKKYTMDANANIPYNPVGPNSNSVVYSVLNAALPALGLSANSIGIQTVYLPPQAGLPPNRIGVYGSALFTGWGQQIP
jgi:YD repeat-containing protein